MKFEIGGELKREVAEAAGNRGGGKPVMNAGRGIPPHAASISKIRATGAERLLNVARRAFLFQATRPPQSSTGSGLRPLTAVAMQSISMRTSLGSRAASMVARAGGLEGK